VILIDTILQTGDPSDKILQTSDLKLYNTSDRSERILQTSDPKLYNTSDR